MDPANSMCLRAADGRLPTAVRYRSVLLLDQAHAGLCLHGARGMQHIQYPVHMPYGISDLVDLHNTVSERSWHDGMVVVTV